MTTTHPDDDLFHALATRARATSDGWLVLAVVGGSTATLIIAVLRPTAWLVIASLGVCTAAFGAWGIADRELAESCGARSISVVVLRGVRVLSVALGVCAAIGAALALLAAALGTWIS